MKKMLLIMTLVSINTVTHTKRYLKPCEPCKSLNKSCNWSGGAQNWYQTPYNGSIGSSQSSFLSEVGYPNPDAARIIV